MSNHQSHSVHADEARNGKVTKARRIGVFGVAVLGLLWSSSAFAECTLEKIKECTRTDPATAEKILLNAIAKNRQPALLAQLGDFYRHAPQMFQDKGQAAWYLRRAANAGDAGAAMNLADMLLSGDGVTKDPRRAVALLEKAAKIGPKAQALLALGEYYRTSGQPEKARLTLQQAADLGSARAKKVLAALVQGVAPPPDDPVVVVAVPRKPKAVVAAPPPPPEAVEPEQVAVDPEAEAQPAEVAQAEPETVEPAPAEVAEAAPEPAEDQTEVAGAVTEMADAEAVAAEGAAETAEDATETVEDEVAVAEAVPETTEDEAAVAEAVPETVEPEQVIAEEAATEQAEEAVAEAAPEATTEPEPDVAVAAVETAEPAPVVVAEAAPEPAPEVVAPAAGNYDPPSTLAGRQLELSEILQIAYDAGFTDEDSLLAAVGTAVAESQLYTAARNWQPERGYRPAKDVIGVPGPPEVWSGKQQMHSDRGLWQIGSQQWPKVKDAATDDPASAARATFLLSRGGLDFSIWDSYQSGRAQRHYDKPFAGWPALRPLVEEFLHGMDIGAGEEEPEVPDAG